MKINFIFISLLLVIPSLHAKSVKSNLSKGKGPAVINIAFENATKEIVALDIARVPGKDEMMDMSVTHIVLQPKERIASVEIPFTASNLYNIDATFAKKINYRAENQKINSYDLIKITSDKNGYHITDSNKAGKMSWSTKRIGK